MLSLTQEKGALDLIFVVLKELGENKIAVAIVLLFLSTGPKSVLNSLYHAKSRHKVMDRLHLR